MNITRRRGAIALSITLGVLLVGGLVAFNIAWIILNERRFALLVLGIILFGAARRRRRPQHRLPRPRGPPQRAPGLLPQRRHPRAQNPHRLHPPLPRNPAAPRIPESQRQEFYNIMLADSDRLLGTVEQVLKAGELGARRRHQTAPCSNSLRWSPTASPSPSSATTCPTTPSSSRPSPAHVRLHVRAIAEDLRTAVLNILDNAVKYSPNGVHVLCSIAIVRLHPGRAHHHRHRPRPGPRPAQAHLQTLLPRPRPQRRPHQRHRHRPLPRPRHRPPARRRHRRRQSRPQPRHHHHPHPPPRESCRITDINLLPATHCACCGRSRALSCFASRSDRSGPSGRTVLLDRI